MIFICGEALLSRGHRGQVSSLPLNVPMRNHVLSQDLVQGMPRGRGRGVGLARHRLDFLSVLRALPIELSSLAITRSSRRVFAGTLRLDDIVFPLVVNPCNW